MPKIRGVKPDLWTDENFVELSPYARLLWIGLWNFACDNGHLQDKSKQIKMRILPTDDVNCADLLREIEGQDLIERSGGWITIPNLSHHQKPHKRWWATCDMPGCVLPEGASHAPANRGTTVAPPKRNRVATADGDCDGESDGDGDTALASSPPEPSTQLAIVKDDTNAGTLVGEWIEHCEQRPPSRVIGQVSKEIKQMLSEGVDPVRLRFGLAEWNRKGLHPSALASVVHEVANRKQQPRRGDIDWEAAFARAAAKTEGAQP